MSLLCLQNEKKKKKYKKTQNVKQVTVTEDMVPGNCGHLFESLRHIKS